MVVEGGAGGAPEARTGDVPEGMEIDVVEHVEENVNEELDESRLMSMLVLSRVEAGVGDAAYCCCTNKDEEGKTRKDA